MPEMINKNCDLCGASLYRRPSSNNKSGLYFCSYLCKNAYQGLDEMYLVPQNTPIFKAVGAVYSQSAMSKRFKNNEYILWIIDFKKERDLIKILLVIIINFFIIIIIFTVILVRLYRYIIRIVL